MFTTIDFLQGEHEKCCKALAEEVARCDLSSAGCLSAWSMAWLIGQGWETEHARELVFDHNFGLTEEVEFGSESKS